MFARRIATLFAAALQIGSAAAQAAQLNLSTADVAEINADAGRPWSEQLARQALTRIKAHEPKPHATVAVNPHALEEARGLDTERRRNAVSLI